MWYNDYVGIPFLAKGREKTGLDCWGLVRLVYKEQYNIELPSLSSDYEIEDSERIAEIAAQYREGWEETSEGVPGSVILFRVLGHISHVGIYIGDNKFIHCREEQSVVIESLDSFTWSKRAVGFFNYKEKSAAVMNVVPHPLRTDRWTVPVPEGTSVAELRNWVVEKFEISKEIKSTVHIIINGIVVQEDQYSTTIVKDTDVIEYRCVARGSKFFRIILTIAVIVAAAFIGPEIFAAGTFGMSASGAAAAGVAVVSTVGNLLIGYLMPIRPPSSSSPGSTEAQSLLNGGSNSTNKYGAIPVVLGRMRITPPLGAENYIDSDTDNSYLNMLLLWGFGPLRVTNMRIGLNDINLYENGAGIPVQQCTLNTSYFPPGTDYNDYNTFNSIYGSDRNQVYLGTTLVCHTSPSNVNIDYGDGFGVAGPWVETTLDQTATTRIDVNFHFPQGLRRLRQTGKYAGDIYEKECQFGLQLKSINADLSDNTSWGNGFAVPLPAVNLVIDQVPAGKYRWYRIGVGPSGYIVKPGAFLTSPYAAFGTGAATAPSTSIYSVFNLGFLNPRLPSFASNEYAIIDVCMSGSSLYTTDSSVKNGNLSGFGVNYTSIKETNFNPGSWSTPTVGTADRGDYLFTIAAGTYYASGSYRWTLGTSTKEGGSGLFVKRKDAFSYTVTVPTAPLAAGKKYVVRVRRLNDDQADDVAEPGRNQDMHQIVLQTITATANNRPIIEKTGWNLTRTALRIKSNDQLNGRIEGVNAIVQTIAKTWNGTSWSGHNATSNPASLFLYVLEHPANIYRIAPADVDTKIDLVALGAWYNFCNLPANMFEYNAVLSDQRSVMDVLRDICAAGRASPAMVNGKWTVIIDDVKANIVQHFTPHNSWGFESNKRLPRVPDGLKVTYYNEDKDWIQDEARVYNNGKNASNAEIFEEINLPGITDYTLATKHARWHLAQAALRPELFTLNTDLEYLVCNRGDRVRVLHDVPLWGISSGRINGLVTTVTPTSITTSGGTATAYFENQTFSLYHPTSTITLAGIPIIAYNGSVTVTACTSTSVSWTSGLTTNVVISGTKSVTTIGGSRTGNIGTATFADQGYVPYTIGTTITFSNVLPSGYTTGTRTVTACTKTSVSWTETIVTAPGTFTQQGTITGAANFNSSTVLTTTSITGSGTIATANFTDQGYTPYAIGSNITITGALPNTYVGTWIVIGSTTSSVSWDSTVTTTATQQGTIRGITIVNSSITTITPKVLKLDEPVALQSALTYTIRVRSASGGSNTWAIVSPSVGNDGNYSTIQLTTTATTTGATAQIGVNDLFMFGTTGKESQDLLVLAVEPFGYQNAKITLVDYAADLFGDIYNTAFAIPSYSSNITLPQKNLIQSITYKPIITNVISDESVMEQISPGNYKINIKISFANPPDLPSNVTHVVTEIDDITGDDVVDWIATPPVPIKSGSVILTGVDETSIYKIRIRYIGQDGRSGPWQTSIVSAINNASSWTSGVITLTTPSNHSFSIGTPVYLYNNNGSNTSLNNIYTVDTVPTKTTLTLRVAQPTTTITTIATTARAGTAIVTYTDKSYIAYQPGTQVTITGASAAYLGNAIVSEADTDRFGFAIGNLLTYSEDLRDSTEVAGRPWTQATTATDLAVTYPAASIANSLGATGTVSKVIYSTATNNILRQVAQQPTVMPPANSIAYSSIEAKAAELTSVTLFIGTKIPTYPMVTFDLSTGTVTRTLGLVSHYGIIDLGNGWYRCWLSANVGTGTSTTGVGYQMPTLSTGTTVSSGLYLTRAQFGLGLYPGPYTAVLAGTVNTLPAAATVQGSVTNSVIVAKIVGAAGTATATFNSNTYLSFGIGSSITVSGSSNVNFNGTFVVTASTGNTVSWTSTTVATVYNATIVRAAVGSWITSTVLQADNSIATGQGLISSSYSTSGTFNSVNLLHRVVGKTSRPAQVTGFTATPDYYTGKVKLTWSANTEIDVQYYELRTEDANWGTEANRLLLGADLNYLATPPGLTATTAPTIGATTTYYVKAIDYSKNYSLAAASVSYIIARPTAVSSASVSYSFASTSKTDTNIVFNWSAPTTSPFNTFNYKVTFVKPNGPAPLTITQFVKDTTWTTPANWTTTASITIETIDILGIYSLPSTAVPVTKSVPGQVVTPDITVAGTSLVFNWAPNTITTMPIYGYEIRTADTNWGTNNSDRIYYGTATTATKDIKPAIPGALIPGNINYYIRAIDVDNQYSGTTRTFTYALAAPAGTTFNIPLFTDTNLTNATVTLTWPAITPIFGLYGYEVSYVNFASVTVTQTINGTTSTLQTAKVWETIGYGDITFTIKVIDNLGNKSTGSTKLISKLRPNAVDQNSFTGKVIDNTVLLNWTTPVASTLPIDHYNIVKGSTYTNSTPVGQKTGTFTTVIEQIAGTYKYWIAAVDTDNQEGPAVSRDVTITQAADYIFNAQYESSFARIYTFVTNTNSTSAITVVSSKNMYTGLAIAITGTGFGGLTQGIYYVVAVIDATTINISPNSDLSTTFVATSTASGAMVVKDLTGTLGANTNCLITENAAFLSVDTTQTGSQHFTAGSHTWATPDSQIAAGFPYFIQPATTSGYYEEVFNYTKLLGSSQITVIPNYTTIGTPVATTTISTATATGGTGTLTNAASSLIVTITSYVATGITTITGNTASTTGWIVGDTITITGATPVGLNGTWALVTVGVGTFTFVTTAAIVSGTYTTGTTVKDTKTLTMVTGTMGSGGLVVGNYITIPNIVTGQTVRITATTATTISVAPPVVLPNTGASFAYISDSTDWTNYTGTNALGISFQYVKVRQTITQGPGNTGPGTSITVAAAAQNVAAAVTGTGLTKFTQTFKVGDVIQFGTSPVQTANITTITTDTAMTITNTLAAITAASGVTYKYFGTDLYKLTGLLAKLDAKQVTETGAVNADLSTNGTVVNFNTNFIDVSAISLSPQGTSPIISVYNFIDNNIAGTYNMSGTTTCNITIPAQSSPGLIAGQRVNLTITSGPAVGIYYVNILASPTPTTSTFSVTLPTAYTTTGTPTVNVYPESMTVFAFNTAGNRTSAPITYSVRGF